MRAPLLAGAVCALALLLTGCGGSSGGGAAGPPVHLSIAAPGDLAPVRSGTVQVRGSVRPVSATVTVAGQQAAVSGGRFSADVELEPGVNVIDVLAASGDGRPALTAVRVRRLMTVAMPDVTGLPTADAKAALERAGLQVDVRRGGGLLDPLLGGDPAVCESAPQPGDQVDAGATVQITVARHC